MHDSCECKKWLVDLGPIEMQALHPRYFAVQLWQSRICHFLWTVVLVIIKGIGKSSWYYKFNCALNKYCQDSSCLMYLRCGNWVMGRDLYALRCRDWLFFFNFWTQGPDIYIEAEIENLTPYALMIDRIAWEPGPLFKVTDLNHLVDWTRLVADYLFSSLSTNLLLACLSILI